LGRKVILNVSTSLDGYIARENGDIDWIFKDPDYGHTDFTKDIDIIILGNRTYRQALALGEFPYKGKRCYVFSKTIMGRTEDVIFINDKFIEFVEKLKKEEGKNIWIVGGTRTIDIFLRGNLIDEIIIAIHPVVLGSGINLFKKYEQQYNLEIINSNVFENGLVKLHYKVIK
jgi:dihydrofolate reductase